MVFSYKQKKYKIVIAYNNNIVSAQSSVRTSLSISLLFHKNHFILDIEGSLEGTCSFKNQMGDGLNKFQVLSNLKILLFNLQKQISNSIELLFPFDLKDFKGIFQSEYKA